MKIFCSYAFTDDNPVDVEKRMRIVANALKAGGHTPYCHLLDRTAEKQNIRLIFAQALQELHNSDAVVAIVTSPNRSIGQLVEIGAALSRNIPIYLYEHMSATNTTYLPELVDKHYTWNTLDDLAELLAHT